MVKFPTIIEFINEVGLYELNANHKEYMEGLKEEISFNDFVESEYASLKDAWEDDLRYQFKRTIEVPFNADNDIELETAKMILVSIVNKAIKGGDVAKMICEEDMVPHYFMLYPVLEEFFEKVLPAVEESLNRLDG